MPYAVLKTFPTSCAVELFLTSSHPKIQIFIFMLAKKTAKNIDKNVDKKNTAT